MSRPWPRHYDDALLRIATEPMDWTPVASAMERQPVEVRARWLKLRSVAPFRRKRFKSRYHSHQLSLEQRAEIVQLYRDNEKVIYIASLFGVSRKTVLRHANAAGLRRRSGNQRVRPIVEELMTSELPKFMIEDVT